MHSKLSHHNTPMEGWVSKKQRERVWKKLGEGKERKKKLEISILNLGQAPTVQKEQRKTEGDISVLNKKLWSNIMVLQRKPKA